MMVLLLVAPLVEVHFRILMRHLTATIVEFDAVVRKEMNVIDGNEFWSNQRFPRRRDSDPE